MITIPENPENMKPTLKYKNLKNIKNSTNEQRRGHNAPRINKINDFKTGKARHKRLCIINVVQTRLKTAKTKHAAPRKCNNEK